MKFGKRELIMSALVVSLGAAVYVNWQFNANADELAQKDSDKELGAAQYVNADIASAVNTSDTASKASSSVSNQKTDTSSKTSSKNESSAVTSTINNTEDYFAKVRLERQQMQDELLELAQEVIEATDSSGKGKEEAVKHLNEMSDTIQQQSNIENLIIAKGFTDCVAFIQNGECSVVVTGQDLKSDTLIAIKDIVMSQTDLSFDKIRVTQI